MRATSAASDERPRRALTLFALTFANAAEAVEVLEAGYLNTEGDVDWMDKAAKQEVEFEQLDEIVDASGNEVKLNKKKKLSAKEKKKLVNRIKKKIADGEDLDSDEENIAIEYNL